MVNINKIKTLAKNQGITIAFIIVDFNCIQFRCHAKFFKNFCKPLDIPHIVWYNIITR